jgi:hypothetical protein
VRYRNGIIGIATVPILIWIILTIAFPPTQDSLREDTPIDKSNIRRLMQDQIDMGPRIPGTQASLDFSTWLHNEVASSIWNVTTQNFIYRDVELRNFWITSANHDVFPEYIIGAHYDSRAVADKEYAHLPHEEQLNYPVPGANDGASGIAGQLEMMKHIPTELVSKIGFVMFDGEDQGSNGMKDSGGLTWGWIVGSQYFVDQLTTEEINTVKAFVLFDMIGDDDLSLPYERRSDSNLVDQIWSQAAQLGYGSVFVNSPGPSLTDDHVPFLNVNIPSIDIIDFTYNEHHTTLDDMNHISEDSVAIVIDVTLAWVSEIHSISLTSDTSSSSIPSTSDLSITTKSRTGSSESNASMSSVSFILIFTVLLIRHKEIKKRLY